MADETHTTRPDPAARAPAPTEQKPPVQTSTWRRYGSISGACVWSERDAGIGREVKLVITEELVPMRLIRSAAPTVAILLAIAVSSPTLSAQGAQTTPAPLELNGIITKLKGKSSFPAIEIKMTSNYSFTTFGAKRS